MKWPPLQLATGKYPIKLSVLKLCLRDDLKTDTFRIRLVDNIHICNNFEFIFSPEKIQSYRRNFQFRQGKCMLWNVNVNYDSNK